MYLKIEFKLNLSVIIPVKNGAATLERCLQSCRSQTIGSSLEIIILDSMSTDSSREIALKYSAIIIDIPEGTFNHGLTRNTGVNHSTGDLVFFTVQDAWLAENNTLEKMAGHFEHKKVKGVVGHQAVPHEKDKNPLIWFKRFSEPVVVYRELKEIEQFRNLSAAGQQSLIAWDDVVAMYSKNALLEQPFVATGFAEDWIWSRDALLRGWCLVYDPSIVVYHYHHQTYQYAYQVAYTLDYHFLKFFNFKPQVPALLLPLAKAIYHLGKHPGLTSKEKLYWILYNVKAKLGNFSSHFNFLFYYYLGGMNKVEKRYRQVCSKIPQGRLK